MIKLIQNDISKQHAYYIKEHILTDASAKHCSFSAICNSMTIFQYFGVNSFFYIILCYQ